MAQSYERKKELARIKYRRKQERKYVEERLKNTPPSKRYRRRTGYVVKYDSTIVKVTEITDTCFWRSTIYKYRTKKVVQDSTIFTSTIFKSAENAKKEYNRYIKREIGYLKDEIKKLQQKIIK